MARIAVVTSAPPLTEGGHLVHARVLVQALQEAGHEAGLVTTPSNRFGQQGTAYLANWSTDVTQTGSGEPIDQVITIRFPSYAVRHPRQVSWLNHTMREYYDRWDDFSTTLSFRGRVKEGMRRRLIHAADTYCFRHHVKKLFAVSATVRDRLQKWNGVAAEVLHPPAPPRPYRCDEYGDFLFFVSRLEALKRADLVIRALAEPAGRTVRLVIGGDGPERARLEALARDLGLSSRITFAGYLDERALVDYLARCRAVVFVPHDEDYGFVTAEAFESSKPVITCRDSGGPTELVTADTGLVVAPTPADVAAACAVLASDQTRAERLGQRAKARIATNTWARAVERLVLPSTPPADGP
jgi:glycosyltransferase involved in cell wall biosynthesis